MVKSSWVDDSLAFLFLTTWFFSACEPIGVQCHRNWRKFSHGCIRTALQPDQQYRSFFPGLWRWILESDWPKSFTQHYRLRWIICLCSWGASMGSGYKRDILLQQRGRGSWTQRYRSQQSNRQDLFEWGCFGYGRWSDRYERYSLQGAFSLVSSHHFILRLRWRLHSSLDRLAWKCPNDERRYRAIQRTDPLHEWGARGQACKSRPDAPVSVVQCYCCIGSLLWTTIQLIKWCQSTFFRQHILHGRSVRLPLHYWPLFGFHRIYSIAMGIILSAFQAWTSTSQSDIQF